MVAAVGGRRYNQIDVTQLLQKRLDEGESWFGLHLKADSGFMYTLNNLGSVIRPDAPQVRLVVQYSDAAVAHAPEPSTLAIWSILGITLFVGRRRFMA